MTVATHAAQKPPTLRYQSATSTPMQRLAFQMPQQSRLSHASQPYQSLIAPQTPASKYAPSGSSFPSDSLSPGSSGTKRKHSTDDDQSPQDVPGNERLSKRLSLLNLEHAAKRQHLTRPGDDDPSSGVDLDYAPTLPGLPGITTSAPGSPYARRHSSPDRRPPSDQMDIDDTKHRVFIYNLDDELSSSDAEPDDHHVTIHPKCRKHFLANRPQFISTAPTDDQAGKQLILYREPSALTIPEEQDTVRKAVVEARQRIRERQRAEAEAAAAAGAALAAPVEEARSRAQAVRKIQARGVDRSSGWSSMPSMSADGFMSGPEVGSSKGQMGGFAFSDFTSAPPVSSAFGSHVMYTTQDMQNQTRQTVYDPNAMDMDID